MVRNRSKRIRKNRRLRRRRYSRRGGGKERTYVFLIPYRARHPQERRREEIIDCINSIEAYFKKYNKKYAMYIVEENNDYPFNKGVLLNAAFLESEKKYDFPRLYIHMNVDYTFDMTMEFPKELENFDGNGFLDIYSLLPGHAVGGASCFGSDTFNKVNGFPNMMYGWGFEDNALKKRADAAKVPIVLTDLVNSGWIIARGSADLARNMKHMDTNKDIMDKTDVKSDGLNTCKYLIDGPGEFDNPERHITHSLINWEKK
jgi:hypothetical protein